MAAHCGGRILRVQPCFFTSVRFFVKKELFFVRPKPVFKKKKQKHEIQEVKEMPPYEGEIVIPNRIQRGPMDVLKLLSSTVGTDYTAPHYKYVDDPYFIPSNNISKKVYSLSRESGKKAAKWLFKEYPQFFQKDTAEPSIEAFMPKEAYDEKSNVSEDLLLKHIKQKEVKTSITLYKLLQKKGVKLSPETKQSLLELTCYYNSEDPIDEEFIQEHWLRQVGPADNRKLWRTDGFAQKLFDSMEPKDRNAYLTMIRCLTKYLNAEEAYNLFQTMQEKKMPLDLPTYNSILGRVSYIRETPESRWDLTVQLLKGMKDDNITPDLGTFNSVFETLSRSGFARPVRNLALQTLAEMKSLNIEPSLGTYYYLLMIFCRVRGTVSTILYDIMDLIEGKEFQIGHPKDVFFFVAAMEICHNPLMDKDLAYRVYDLLQFGNNYSLIGDSLKDSIFYQHFFKVLCATEAIEKFFEIYYKLVPNIYVPEPSVMVEIIKAVELNGIPKYISQLWSDIIVFDMVPREQVMDAFINLLYNTMTDDKEQLETLGNIAYDVKIRVDNSNVDKLKASVQWTGTMVGSIIVVCLRANQYERACEIMKEVQNEDNRIAGIPSLDTLKVFLKASKEKNDFDNCLACLKYMESVGYSEVAELAQELIKESNFNEMQRNRLCSIGGGYAGIQNEI